MQHTVELASSVLQTPNVYVAEIIDTKPLLEKAFSPNEKAPSQKHEANFMFTAVTPMNNFLMGDTLPSSTTTYKHFNGPNKNEPLAISIKEAWDQLHFFKKDLLKPSSSSIMYVAAPYFDIKGQIRGYIAADALRMHEGLVYSAVHP